MPLIKVKDETLEKMGMTWNPAHEKRHYYEAIFNRLIEKAKKYEDISEIVREYEDDECQDY